MRGVIPPLGPGERDTIVDGVRWRSREVEGRGDPVVYVHGLFASSSIWQDVLGRAEAGRPGIALDFPGSGGSERPWPWDYTVEGLKSALLAYLDARGIRRAVLVGSSFGGAIAMLVAADNPERVERLVLVASASPESRPLWTLRLLRFRVAGDAALALLRRPMLAWGHRHQLYARAERVSDRAIDEAWRALRIPGTRRAALRSIRSDPRPYLGMESKIRTPTLVIWGDSDRILPPSEGPRLASRIPGAKLVVIPGAGHLPQREQPAAFAQAVADFLSGRGVGVPPREGGRRSTVT